MKIVVHGLWHLGSVTAACCARHFNVTGLEEDDAVIANLRNARAPLHEPGLNELLAAGLARGSLRFTTDAVAACAEAELLWLTRDTPVDDDDNADVDAVLKRARRSLSHLRPGTIALISAQLLVGTCRRLEQEFPHLLFACSPENLRLGKAIEAFTQAERVIVGTRNEAPHARLAELFAPFTQRVIFMRTESAEMVKHALNSFLALSITFINEVARLCEHTGADAAEVAVGLKSEPRIGPRAYLGPGGPFAGGTLARDVVALTRLAEAKREPLEVIPAIKRSNDHHRRWAFERLRSRLGELRGRTVAILGLVYTPGTDTLRRSAAVELCEALLAAGAHVRAFDPAVRQLPANLAVVTCTADASDALYDADAVVVCTEWPEFRALDWAAQLAGMRQRIVIDANRFLEKQLAGHAGVEFFSVGRA